MKSNHNKTIGRREGVEEKKGDQWIPENLTPSIHSAVITRREVMSWYIFGMYTCFDKFEFREISSFHQI